MPLNILDPTLYLIFHTWQRFIWRTTGFTFNFCISCIVLFSCFCSTSESSFFCLLIKTIYFLKIWKLFFLICKVVLETVPIFARCKTPLCNLPLDMEKHFTSVRWTQCIVHFTLYIAVQIALDGISAVPWTMYVTRTSSHFTWKAPLRKADCANCSAFCIASLAHVCRGVR